MTTNTEQHSTKDRILTAIAAHGPATARDISQLVGAGYSTTTAQLRRLADAGLIVRSDREAEPALWAPISAVTDMATTSPRSNSTGPAPTDPAPITPTPTRATPSDTAEPQSSPTEQPYTAVPATQDVSSSSAAARRAHRRERGQLRAETAAVLDEHPGLAYKVSELSHLLDPASPGAIANALHTLVRYGTARQVTTAPASFQTNYAAGHLVAVGHVATGDGPAHVGDTGTVTDVRGTTIHIAYDSGSSGTVDLHQGDRLLHRPDTRPAGDRTADETKPGIAEAGKGRIR